MYQNILVAVDGSPSSKRAHREAVCLATLTHGVVNAIYVVDRTPLFSYAGYYDPIALVDALRKDGRSALDEVEQACKAAGVTCHTELVETSRLSDDVATVLQQHADQLQADLLVMGTHGRRGVRRLVLGSVAERVLRFSKCPVLLLRDEENREAGSA